MTHTYQVSATDSRVTSTSNHVQTFQLILTCVVTSISLTSTNNPTVLYTIGQASPASLSLPTYTTFPPNCTPPTLSLVASSEPAILTQTASEIQISTTDYAHLGTHTYKINATAGAVVNSEFSLTVIIKCSVTMTAPTSPLVPAMTYPISGSSHQI